MKARVQTGGGNFSNIAMLLTAPGVSALAVVRLCGSGVDDFLARHFTGRVAAERCAVGRIVSEIGPGGQSIDEVVVARLGDRPGRSPTADISLHGGTYIVEAMLELAKSAGFVVANQADLDMAVELADGETPIDREVFAHLPQASTELAVQVLTGQPALWAELERGATAAIEPAAQRAILRDRSLWRLLHPPAVAIVGVPNVGKSTIANALFGRERAITADHPGTTRDWVGGLAKVDGLIVRLIDTPGMRRTEDAIEAAAIGKAARVIGQAKLVVVVLDPTQEPESQQAILNRHAGAIAVVNKSDLRRQWSPSAEAIETVATRGDGIAALRVAIRRRLIGDDVSPATARWWTRRQRHWLIENIRRGCWLL